MTIIKQITDIFLSIINHSERKQELKKFLISEYGKKEGEAFYHRYVH
jgi:hypothetical protein